MGSGFGLFGLGLLSGLGLGLLPGRTSSFISSSALRNMERSDYFRTNGTCQNRTVIPRWSYPKYTTKLFFKWHNNFLCYLVSHLSTPECPGPKCDPWRLRPLGPSFHSLRSKNRLRRSNYLFFFLDHSCLSLAHTRMSLC